MNLKYYLRGLGIGIIVTALIMGIAASGKKETLSDSEVIERAKALGMIEETTLIADAVSDETPESAADATSQPTAAATATPNMTPQPTATAMPAATPQPTAAATVMPDVTPQPTAAAAPSPTALAAAEHDVSAEPVENAETVTIQINSGDGSYSACKLLEDAGLVESASEFDRYLYDNGYDKRINAGIFEIPKGAGPEQIAKILARLE